MNLSFPYYLHQIISAKTEKKKYYELFWGTLFGCPNKPVTSLLFCPDSTPKNQLTAEHVTVIIKVNAH